MFALRFDVYKFQGRIVSILHPFTRSRAPRGIMDISNGGLDERIFALRSVYRSLRFTLSLVLFLILQYQVCSMTSMLARDNGNTVTEPPWCNS